jgi:acetolactate synthase I/II/III large subunit
MGKMTGWQAVVDALRAEGVRRVYGLPGDPVHLYDALYDVPQITPVLVRHEGSGAFMAMAEARLTNRVAVAHGSPGPGMTNLVSGMLEAYSACSPVIFITTGAPSRLTGMGAFQENDAVGIARPITKWTVRVERPERIPWTMRRAFALASTGKPGPVHVEIPADVGTASADMEPYRPSPRPLRCVADPEALKRAAEMVAASECPVLVAGGGAVLSGAGANLLALAEQEHVPVMTTFSGRGTISEAHPLAFGLVGLYRTRPGKELFDGADLLITVGSRMEGFQSGDWKIFPDRARFLQIDIDPFEIGRNWVPDAALIGDASLVLRQLHAAFAASPGTRAARKTNAEARVRDKDAFAREVDAECAAATGVPLASKRIVHELNAVFGHDTILVNENGGQDLWSYFHPYYRVLDAGDLVPMGEQTCMGAGVTGAIGAKLARPEKKVVCVAGDGAFYMMPQELSTAVQYRAPVTWVVLNTHGLGWPKWSQVKRGGRYIATDFTAQGDIAAIARAHGCSGERVERPEEIAPALRRALAANGAGTPVVVEFVVDTFDYYVGFKNFPNKEWTAEPQGAGSR